MKASALYIIRDVYLLTSIDFLFYFFLLNRYVSALSEVAEQPNLQSAVSSGWPASLHLIGKVWHLLCIYDFFFLLRKYITLVWMFHIFNWHAIYNWHQNVMFSMLVIPIDLWPCSLECGLLCHMLSKDAC